MSLVPYLIRLSVFVFVSLLLCMGPFISGGLASGSKEDANMTNARSCNDNERQVLQDFKANLVDRNNSLHDWGNKEEDCCQWVGVTCNDQTGHVIELDLSTASNGLSGNMSPLLPLLSQLQHLDLSGINFQLNPIPNALSSLTSLRYLNISAANHSGSIPHQLANLPNLAQLDLSSNLLSGWIPHQLANLSNLVQLDLSSNLLSGWIPHQLANLSNLVQLDLSSNLLSGWIPVSFGKFSSLTHLYLSRNRLEGVVPLSLGNLSSLVHLDLSKNLLNGSIPNFAGCSSMKELIQNSSSVYNKRGSNSTGCPPLQKLDLSRNGLTGTLPLSVGKLLNLEHLDVSYNSLDGSISDVYFLNLTQLTYLDLSFNSFELNLSSHAKFGFKLNAIKMQSCKLGPSFPMWIQTQRYFAYLDMSNAGISDRIPGWFWDLPRGLRFLNLSSNEIQGMLPNMTLVFERYPGMDLSYNQLEGTIPMLPSKLAALNLSRNKFSGTLSFLCQIDKSLTFLDLSNNFFSGSIPDCLQKFQENLVVLNLSNNSLSGEIPSFLGSLSKLQALYLRKNAFVGEIPASLSNCTKLKFVDLGENKFSGNIPTWIGERLSELVVLVIWSNKLEGSLPHQMCLLNNLQVLDLSDNGLSGNIPRCFGNFTAMATREFQDDIIGHSYSSYVSTPPETQKNFCHIKYTSHESNLHFIYYALNAGNPAYGNSCGGRYYFGGPNEEALFIDNALVAWKGTRREFGRGLYLLKIIDISCNMLYGNLPEEITNLLDLVSLNLSNNRLHGQIPERMDQLKFIDSLDLSRNEFSGNIPSSLSQITLLSYLNLSYNNLSGRIPTGTQLQRFSSSSFIGNPQLCGPPLTPSCGLSPPPATVVGKEDVDELWKSYYMGMGSGFGVGFWGICGALFLNRRCRYFLFVSLNNVKDWIYVIVSVYFQNLHRKLNR
ncbi:hypothetical protein R6Q57_005118 [Mikania cordata]